MTGGATELFGVFAASLHLAQSSQDVGLCDVAAAALWARPLARLVQEAGEPKAARELAVQAATACTALLQDALRVSSSSRSVMRDNRQQLTAASALCAVALDFLDDFSNDFARKAPSRDEDEDEAEACALALLATAMRFDRTLTDSASSSDLPYSLLRRGCCARALEVWSRASNRCALFAKQHLDCEHSGTSEQTCARARDAIRRCKAALAVFLFFQSSAQFFYIRFMLGLYEALSLSLEGDVQRVFSKSTRTRFARF